MAADNKIGKVYKVRGYKRKAYTKPAQKVRAHEVSGYTRTVGGNKTKNKK